MTELQIFKNDEFGTVRTTEIDGDIYFVGKDVAEALGYRDTSDAIKRHIDEEDKLTRCFTDSGQNREMYVVNESGLYSLILSSKLPSAKKFKHWVTSEVLPSIRKTGGYHLPQTYTEALEELLIKAKENERLLVDNERMKPKEVFADAVTASNNSILVRDLAKILRQNGIKTGEKRLYRWLRDKGYIIYNSTRPTQKAMEQGLFEIIESTVQRSDLAPITTMTTKVTGKGQQYFINKFLGDNGNAKSEFT